MRESRACWPRTEISKLNCNALVSDTIPSGSQAFVALNWQSKWMRLNNAQADCRLGEPESPVLFMDEQSGQPVADFRCAFSLASVGE